MLRRLELELPLRIILRNCGIFAKDFIKGSARFKGEGNPPGIGEEQRLIGLNPTPICWYHDPITEEVRLSRSDQINMIDLILLLISVGKAVRNEKVDNIISRNLLPV